MHADYVQRIPIPVQWRVAPSGLAHAFTIERNVLDDTSICGLSSTSLSGSWVRLGDCVRCCTMVGADSTRVPPP